MYVGLRHAYLKRRTRAGAYDDDVTWAGRDLFRNRMHFCPLVWPFIPLPAPV